MRFVKGFLSLENIFLEYSIASSQQLLSDPDNKNNNIYIIYENYIFIKLHIQNNNNSSRICWVGLHLYQKSIQLITNFLTVKY